MNKKLAEYYYSEMMKEAKTITGRYNVRMGFEISSNEIKEEIMKLAEATEVTNENETALAVVKFNCK